MIAQTNSIAISANQLAFSVGECHGLPKAVAGYLPLYAAKCGSVRLPTNEV
jgi:hypothetical protein